MDKKATEKILLIVKYPPPVSGFKLMNKYLLESQLLSNSFQLESIRLIFNSRINNTFTKNLYNLIRLIGYLVYLIIKLISYRPNLVYFTISPVKQFVRDLLFVVILKLFKRKIIYHLHGKGIAKQIQNNRLKKRLYEYAYKKVNVICLSNLLTYDITQIYKDYIYILNNGIVPTIENFGIKKSRSTSHILFLSNLLETKGIFVLIDALNILHKSGSTFYCAIVGHDTYDISKQALLSYIENYELIDSVKYLGPLLGREKEHMFLNSDIFVYPTNDDAFPLVLLEAMQAGSPIISTNEGAIPEMVDNDVTGLLVEKNNPFQLAKKIKLLIESPELVINMGIAARKKFLGKYTFYTYEKNLANIFNDVLTKNRDTSN